MDTRQALIEGLTGSWFGLDLPAQARARLLELASLRTYQPGTVVDREGDPTVELGLVRSGRIALRTSVPERGEITILTVEAGDVFGWSSLVPPHRATATAVATDLVEAVVFPAGPLRAALHADDALAATVYPLILRAVARRLAATRLQVLDLFRGQEVAAW
jgi:CRP/FNR family cyclic AMP-dependent transcriptional regulator